MIFFLLVLVPIVVHGQQAEYNMSSYWVYPAAEKHIKISFVNMPNGELINNGYIGYDGDFTNNGKVNFTTTKACNPGLSEFSGSSLQHISGSGDTTRFYNLKFNHQLVAGAVSLEQTIAVAHQVDFSTGIVTASQPTYILSLEADAQAINASDRSYMNGFVSKTGNSKFSFPVGDSGYYRPITIEPQGLASDCFAARYVFANPETAGYTRSSKDATLASISDKEYWVLNHSNGTGKSQVTLSWDVTKTSAAVPKNLINLAVARWNTNSSSWVNEGNIATLGDENSGIITANITGDGIFALANIVTQPPVAVNDTVNTDENTAANGNVLTNDSVFNGTLTLVNFSINGTSYQPGTTASIANVGTISLAANGLFTFTPVLNYSGLVPAINYTISDINSNTDTGDLIIQVLALPEFIKTAGKPVMNNDGSFSWTYKLNILNDTPNTINNVQVEDNLDDVFKDKGCTYVVTGILASGRLTANGLYNGSSNTKTLIDGLSLLPHQLDSIQIGVKVNPQGQANIVTVLNQAILKATAVFGETSQKSRTSNMIMIPDPTQTDIPVIDAIIPEGFSPNGDGLNDKFVITHLHQSKIELEIFNRYGNSVYKSSDYQNDWDGTGSAAFLGRELPDGTYYCAYKEISLSTGDIINKGVKYINIRR